MRTLLVNRLKNSDIDWVLFAAVLPILGAGLVTMDSFVGENYFFEKQIVWIFFALAIFFALSFIDFRFLRRTGVLVTLFMAAIIVLVALLGLDQAVKGARSWLDFGAFSFQPSDPIKLLVILILAKYFSRRHIEIAHIRHIIVSGAYAGIPFLLVFLQPDLGSAIIIFFIWLGMVLVSGISKKHLLLVFFLGLVLFGVLWSFVFEEYQQQRVLTFLNPLTDIQGTGYNAYQSMVAVGSGEIMGKGVGYGTQSRLQFLPEYETDFIFAAFAEEWGFVGVLILFALFAIVIWRILSNSLLGATNFEMLFGMGLAIMLISHFTVHVGMNIGLLPVTGTTIPFMSYGGSHLVTEFTGLGILMGMRRYRRTAHRDDIKNEFLGM
ncbi:MAG: rod shape-determining protein RodA [Patescibacteria group bacterium]|nr:MAG: rod shape-determining protein RodA [Patescibacteria group bacterium]